jgi:4-hydroxybenzoate polyprenyltransferase
MAKNLLQFIRYKVCLYVTSMALTGYLLFNPVDATLLPVALTTSTLTGAAYALNRRADTDEDELNHKKINQYTRNRGGILIIGALILTSIWSVSHLSKYSQIFCLIGLVFGIIYYKIKVKQIARIKNIYAMLSISSMFMLGATATPSTTPIVALYYLNICICVLSISVLADLRDYEGDRLVGVASIPVLYGYNSARLLVSLMLASLTLTAVMLQLPTFYLLAVCIPAIIYFIWDRRIQAAYNSLFISFLTMPMSTIAVSII